MKKTSMLIGALLAAVVLLGVAAVESDRREIGRFQVQTCPAQAGGLRGTGFFVVIDTTNGEVWMGNGMEMQLRSSPNAFLPKVTP
jgi:hypothetical protein